MEAITITSEMILNVLTSFWFIFSIVTLISVRLMFFWEGANLKWWIRLPYINLVFLVIFFIMGCIEEVFLTFHPEERTTYFKSSIFQMYFTKNSKTL